MDDGEVVVSVATRPDHMALVQNVTGGCRNLHFPEKHLASPLHSHPHKGVVNPILVCYVNYIHGLIIMFYHYRFQLGPVASSHIGHLVSAVT